MASKMVVRSVEWMEIDGGFPWVGAMVVEVCITFIPPTNSARNYLLYLPTTHTLSAEESILLPIHISTYRERHTGQGRDKHFSFPEQLSLTHLPTALLALIYQST